MRRSPPRSPVRSSRADQNAGSSMRSHSAGGMGIRTSCRVYAGTPMSTVSLSAAQRNAVAELLRVSPVADELGRRFAAAGHELHLVGGSVRDALLGRLGDDLDFCTDAHPDETQRLLKAWAVAICTTGAEFGTIGAAKRGLRVEITTYR